MRIWTLFSLFICCCLSYSQETYMGVFMQGQKIGYAMVEQTEEVLAGKKLNKTTSRSFFNLALLGQDMKITTDSVSWSRSDGRPVLMKMATESAGRTQRIEANFQATQVHIAIDNSGNKSSKVLAIPKDAPIVDDPTNAFLAEGDPSTKGKSFYVLDSTTINFVKNTVRVVGPTEIEMDGKKIQANLIEVSEPRMSMKVYLSQKGDLIKITSIAGLEMIPMPKEQALADTGVAKPIDLAEATRIRVTSAPGDLLDRKVATYRFFGVNLGKIPQDGGQSAKPDSETWVVTVRPNQPNFASSATLGQLAKSQPAWLKPGMNVPSNDPSIVQTAKKIVGAETHPVKAAHKIADYVHDTMRFDAGIGVLRDPREILKTKEGVCRDYAVVMATLLRAAKIPTRLVSGLVYDSGAFYYHAWVECWDGKQWYGLDATRSRHSLTPGHVKLAQGSVEDVFLYTFLDSAKATFIR